jgi:hypothetical protein
MGRSLITVGLLLAGIGVFFLLAERFPEKTGWIGKLPGDFFIERKNFKFYFPVTTSILISLFLTLIFWLFGKR